MMNMHLMYNFYSFDMNKVNVFFHCFMRLLKEKLPRLANMFVELGLQCSVFLFEWVVALFSNILSLDISARIWDSYLFYGDHYLMKVCIGMCACLEQQVSEDNFEQLVIIFKTVDKYVTEEALFKAI